MHARGIVVLAALALPVGAALAHHSYAMFDMSKAKIVEGSVAKLEWVNPHVFVWIYVKKPTEPGKYDLYAFENGPMARSCKAIRMRRA